MIIAVVGSGGKTTLIKKLASQYLSAGKTVFVTTTTHMFIEKDTLLTDDPDTIIQRLKEKGYAMAGIVEGEKIKSLSLKTYEAVCTFADVVLVEADGSKHMPLKFPNACEPVIPDNTDRIIVVWGSHGLYKPAREVCHRLELVMKCLRIDEETVIGIEHVQKLIRDGYILPLQNSHPQVEISVYPNL